MLWQNITIDRGSNHASYKLSKHNNTKFTFYEEIIAIIFIITIKRYLPDKLFSLCYHTINIKR